MELWDTLSNFYTNDWPYRAALALILAASFITAWRLGALREYFYFFLAAFFATKATFHPHPQCQQPLPFDYLLVSLFVISLGSAKRSGFFADYLFAILAILFTPFILIITLGGLPTLAHGVDGVSTIKLETASTAMLAACLILVTGYYFLARKYWSVEKLGVLFLAMALCFIWLVMVAMADSLAIELVIGAMLLFALLLAAKRVMDKYRIQALWLYFLSAFFGMIMAQVPNLFFLRMCASARMDSAF